MNDQEDIWQQLRESSIPGDDNGSPAPVADPRQRLAAFRRYNKLRLQRLRQGLEGRRRQVFELVPLLLHQPLAGTPGGEQPQRGGFGIINFEACESMRQALENLYPPAPWRPGALLGRPVIESLLIMGSMGTMAQTARSDLDVWVIHKAGILGTGQHQRLLERLRIIEEWANGQGLELHFFPLTAEQVRRAEFGTVGPESAGSALREMLREEFFRTHLLWQGQVPLWWLSDPGGDDDSYQELLWRLPSEPRLDSDAFIDLGNSRPVSADEYLGACLWQIVKSLRRPFKSLLKLTLLERVMRWPDARLLCDELKARVHAGLGDDPWSADPYFIVVDTVVSDFRRGGLPHIAALLQRCFYLQISAALSGNDATPSRRLLARLAEAWGWSAAEQAWLDDYHRWPFAEILALGQEIEHYMDGILEGLRQQLGGSATAAIDKQDLELLENKVRTSRAMHPEQVPLLPIGYFPGDLEQHQLLFRHEDEGWWLRGDEQTDLAGPFAEPGLAAQFSVINGLYGPATILATDADLPAAPLRQRLERMYRLFGRARPENVPLDDFRWPARARTVLLEVTAHSRPPSEIPRTTRLAGNWDLLEYDRQRRSLLKHVDCWTLTSWGTVLHHGYAGRELPRLLLEVTEAARRGGLAHLECAPANTAAESLALAKRLQLLLQQLQQAMAQGGGRQDRPRAFLVAISGQDWAFVAEAGDISLVGPLSGRERQSFLLQGGRRLLVEAGSMRLRRLRWALQQHTPGREEALLFSGEQAGVVACGSRDEVYELDGNLAMVGQTLELVGGSGLVRACYEETAGGSYAERGWQQPAQVTADVVVELLEAGKMRWWVEEMARPARGLEQAATWLLSRWKPGQERRPLLRLRPGPGGWTLGLPQRLQLHQQLLEKLESLCRRRFWRRGEKIADAG